MPELPEVETVCRRLRPFVDGKQIADVRVLDTRTIKGEDAYVWEQQVVGQTIEAVERRGKFILFRFVNGYLLTHLRMEGKFFMHGAKTDPVKHTHVVFRFTDGSELHYNDVRKFGTMELKTMEDVYTTPPLSKLAPEPFSTDVTGETLYRRFQTLKTRAIKTTLLDQHVFVGLGNIYVDETLFRAGVHPTRPASTLLLEEVMRVHAEAVAVLQEAIERGGSTIRSYRDPSGQQGAFQEVLYVYGRQGQACLRCGTTIEKIKLGGRGTHFCPHCQV